MKKRRTSDRGAVLVEYAMGAALILVATLGVTEALADDAEDRLDERGAAIGSPGDEALGGAAGDSGDGGDGDDGEVPPEDPPTPYTGDIQFEGCTGSPDRNVCAFSLTVPPEPEVPVWTTNPTTHVTGSGTVGNTATLTFGQKGTYSVRSTVGSNVVQFEIVCTKSGPVVSCDAAD